MADLVLAFDTATDRCALALGEFEDGRLVRVLAADLDAPRAALGRLLPAVARLLAEEGRTPADLSCVVVGRGPGSFTGVRIGVASAKGLAHGLGVPLFGVGTLDALAWGCATQASGLLGVVADAMRGEVYPALFRLAHGRAERLTDDTVLRPAHIGDAWGALDEPLLLAGTGLEKHGDAILGALGPRAVDRVLPASCWLPTGAGLLAAFEAARATGSSGDGDPATLLPIYTRLSDAEEAERERAREGGAR